MNGPQGMSWGSSCVKALRGRWWFASVSKPGFDNRSLKLSVVVLYAGLSCGRSGSSVEGAEALEGAAR